MAMSDLTKLMAQNILFSDGESLQEKLENGAFAARKENREKTAQRDAFRWKGDDGSTGNRSRCSEHRNG